jgi:hypothetical protein
MTILNKLSTTLGRRDEVPNQLLAAEIVRSKDRNAVQELIDNLSNKNRRIQSDCIKVLYEIGECDPRLLAAHYKIFGDLLESPNNRLAWGAMTALDTIASIEPKSVYGLLGKVLQVADKGSVITRDHAVGILIKLAGEKQYYAKCFALLLEQLLSCPNNQLPMYAERSIELILGSSPGDKAAMEKVLTKRLPGMEKESQKTRIAKVLKRLSR